VQIAAVNDIMGTLVSRIGQVADGVQLIAGSSRTQSAALSEVVVAVGDLDDVTAANSALVERTQHRSMRLIERSDQLIHAVGYIKLRQGTADEAKALVLQAQSLVAKIGFDRAREEFHRAGGAFIFKDLYIFAFDREGIYRALGSDRSKVGKHVGTQPGINAEQMLQDAWKRAEQGGGWIEHNIINLQTGNVRGKSSYVAPVNDCLLIGCGAYRSEIGVIVPPATLVHHA
jgi:signal transduction histidine kinase